MTPRATIGRRRTAALVALGILVTGCSGFSQADTSTAPDPSVTITIVTDDAGTTTSQSSTGESSGESATGDTDPSGADRSTYTIVAQATVGEVVARTAPGIDAEPIATLANPTQSGAPLVFRAVDGGAASPDWVEVHLPIQPNGSTGWVPRSELALSNNPYRVEISRADYVLRVFELESLIVEAPIAVGNGATPTPVGDFYLLELLAPSDPTGAYGPFAFGLSGFSEVLTSFGGADEAIIGIHGTNDPSSLGTDVSHGCVRLENSVIEQLASTLPLGTPVAIS